MAESGWDWFSWVAEQFVDLRRKWWQDVLLSYTRGCCSRDTRGRDTRHTRARQEERPSPPQRIIQFSTLLYCQMESDVKHEFRFYILTRFKIGINAKTIHEELVQAWGESAPSYSTTTFWIRRFKEEGDVLEDDSRLGRPISATSDKNVLEVLHIIQEDAHVTLEQIACDVGISKERIHFILVEKLGLRKVCSRWVPHLLTTEQKRDRVEKAQVLLDKFGHEGQYPVTRVFTGDETWLHYYQLPGKVANMVWLGGNDLPPTVLHQQSHVKKVMFAIFFRFDGPLAQVPLPVGSTVTGHWYAKVCLPIVISKLRKERPKIGTNDLFLLHDNASPHKSSDVGKVLKNAGIVQLDHPAYSPDLSPCDFFLFPTLKQDLAGRRFDDLNEIKRALKKSLHSISKETYRSAFDDWLHRLQKCIDAKGEYFEKTM